MLRSAARVEVGLVALAAALAVCARGGFPDAARALFTLLAGCALLATAIVDRDAASRAARSPVVVVLGLLAVVAALSAAWTIGEPSDAVRYALVVAAYAALLISAAVIARERAGLIAICATLAALAAASGVVGLFGAAIQEAPYGQRIGGSWEAAGLFEYAPANALLQVAALPTLINAMCGRRRRLALAAAVGAAVAGAVIGLSDSLYNQLAAVALLGLAIAWPARTVRSSRTTAVGAALLVVVAGIGAHLIAGRYAPPCDYGGDGARLAGMVALVIALAAAWALARPALLHERASRRGPAAALLIAAALAIGGLAIDSAGSCTAPTEGVEPYAGLLHGRIDLWSAAIDVAGDHPVLGAGADTYGLASSEYQEGRPVLYAHDLPLELWAELGVLGLLCGLALYVCVAVELGRARRTPALWLAGPATAAFMLANLVDFPWHLAGAGAVWALTTGAILGANRVNAYHRP